MEESFFTARGARILGAHIEGPFLSPERKGAHDPENLRPVDLGLLKDILGAGPVSVMTLAPELPRVERPPDFYAKAGRWRASDIPTPPTREILHALDAGFSKATHLYNAMSPFEHRAPGSYRGGAHRRPGPGGHNRRRRTRPRGRAPSRVQGEREQKGLALVTDAMEAAGMDDGEYELSGRTVRLEGGYVRLPDGTLAGSSLTMDGAVHGTP